jgi:hypothetical protein
MQGQDLKSEAPRSPERARELLGHPRVRLGAVVALAVVAGLIAWAIIGSGDNSSPKANTATVSPVGPVGLSAQGLRNRVASLNQPIYWAGPKPGYVYELTRTDSGNVYVRYLPPGANPGAPGAPYLIIATYPFGNALQALIAVSHGKQLNLPGGGIALVDEKYPKSVHVAFPGVNYQIEVYDPSPARSRRVAVSGDVRPVR